jgi:RimJ/RimL family protein N-acetyltransferase
MISDLSHWTPRKLPSLEPMQGRFVRLEPMVDGRHFDDLWQSFSADTDNAIWSYLPYGPFLEKSGFFTFAERLYLGTDPMFHALIDLADGKAKGVASLMRIVPDHGVIETGHICYGPSIQKTPATTEAQYLFGCRVFDELGYRRFEWKCNNANAASKRAALRFGFTFEGVFRQMLIVKGKNRDTAWYSIVDHEWPILKTAYERWLSPDNFDVEGRQKMRLEDLREK